MATSSDDSQARLVIRPSLAAWRRALVAKGNLPIVAMLVLLFASSRDDRLALIGSLLAISIVALTAVLGYWQYARVVRIIIDSSVLRIRSWRGHETVVPRHEIGGIALREIPGAWGRRRALFIVYGRTHHCYAAFDRRLWREEDIRQLEAILCHRTPSSRVASYDQLAREFPGSVAWWRLHGTLLGMMLPLVVLVIIILGSVFSTVRGGGT